MLVSIIMGAHNCASTVELMMQSIIRQSYSNWELIICDDGSTDHTYELLMNYSKIDSRIKILKNLNNLGLNKTLNKCLKLARGEYICRLDADDIAGEKCIELLVSELNINPSFDIISAASYLTDECGVWGITKVIEIPTKENFLVGAPIPHVPSLSRKTVFLTVGGYSEAKIHKRCEDYYLWALAYSKGFKAKNMSIPLYYKNENRDALSKRILKEYLNATLVSFQVYKLLKIPFYLYPIALRGLLVGLLPKFVYHKLHRNRFEKNLVSNHESSR